MTLKRAALAVPLIGLSVCLVSLPLLASSLAGDYRATFVPKAEIAAVYNTPTIGQRLSPPGLKRFSEYAMWTLLVVSDCTGCNARRVAEFRRRFPKGVVAAYKSFPEGSRPEVPSGADVLLTETDAKELGLTMLPCLYQFGPNGALRFVQSSSDPIESALEKVERV